MKTLNYVNLMLLFVLSLSFASCGDDNYYTDDFLRNSDEKLCSKKWMNDYEQDEKRYRRILVFERDYKGREYLRTWNKLPSGEWNSEHSEVMHPFTWAWLNNEKEGLKMDFYGDRTYNFHDVWVRQHYLSGYLNGEEVTFLDERYATK